MVLPSRTEKYRRKNARLRGHFLCFGVADGEPLAISDTQCSCGFQAGRYTALCNSQCNTLLMQTGMYLRIVAASIPCALHETHTLKTSGPIQSNWQNRSFKLFKRQVTEAHSDIYVLNIFYKVESSISVCNTHNIQKKHEGRKANNWFKHLQVFRSVKNSWT